MAVDKKTQKYDRQLRLWQAHGQAALERAHVCLINGTATGTEALKDLVLPGVGAFTVVDAAVVTPADLGNNFFVTPSHLGMPRAKVVTQLLKELNEDVDGKFVCEDAAALLANDPAFFHQFTLVIVTGRVSLASLLALDRELYPRAIPLLVARNAGFVASLRTVLHSHHVVEYHPDSPQRDMRLANPWPELVAFVDSFAPFDSMTGEALTHVPYPVILMRVYREWRQANPDAENRHFKAYLVAEKTRHSARLGEAARLATMASAPPGVEVSMTAIATAVASATDLENWDEAVAAAYLAYTDLDLDSHVKSTLFAHPILNEADSGSAPSASSDVLVPRSASALAPGSASGPAWPPAFWSVAGGLKSYVAETRSLPVKGTVPDMKADTTTYVKLQHVYRAKAAVDLAALRSHIRPVSVSAVAPVAAGMGAASPGSSASGLAPVTDATATAVPVALTTLSVTSEQLDDDTISTFVRNANYARLLSTPSLTSEYTAPDAARARDLLAGESAAPASELAIHVLFRATERFHAMHKRWPGEHTADHDDDVAALRAAARDVVRLMAAGAEITADGQVVDATGAAATAAASVAASPGMVDLDDWVQEFVRAGPAELHSIAAYMGGVVSQEAIKIITSQYLPLAGTYVYNAIASTSAVV